MAETEQKPRSQWNVNPGAADGYFKPDQREALLERIRASGIRYRDGGDGIAEAGDSDARLSIGIRRRCMGVGGTYDVLPAM